MWFWKPKEDITVYELACALGVLFPVAAGGLGAMSKDGDAIKRAVESLPESAQRHFLFETK